ncbi:sulfurtransferase complex subunit TusB [Endozoicomonas gorgoniicola]|uniref:Sulfurtransferase complex subunit TusB n=1 Tax=Endozoicomonas gorgoniicola TaxID=1234144 RepID=A0ABT3MVA4_9GAMM|nr:sulfurtransferase complex subunit TusB [Endozoicomonas gorgoniicola]MCW7553018.1 sulfurtransferase complex subunit TusB [Endozoicomonas gorgoniicola]
MSTLHTVNKAGQALELCLRSLLLGDAILLIEDAVYALFEASDVLREVILDIPVYVLEADVLARGVSNRDDLNITAVDYDGFVELTEAHDKVLGWH